jgi:hypothetical protein
MTIQPLAIVTGVAIAAILVGLVALLAWFTETYGE